MKFKIVLLCLIAADALAAAETVAFWPFDEAAGLYPSSVLSDLAGQGGPLILGPGGSIVPGRFGRALSTKDQPVVQYPLVEEGTLFGLTQLPVPAGRTVPPLSWMNAHFTALNTAGEKHLRKEVAQPNPVETGLNLGAGDWTVEFWYQPAGAPADADGGVVFELGSGPRGENDRITALSLDRDRTGFTLVNQPAGWRVTIPSDAVALQRNGDWVHLAFVYDAGAHRLAHYVDGRLQPAAGEVSMKPLPPGAESYFSVGRDARWARTLPGALDELRFSTGRVYTGPFAPPGTFVADAGAGAPARKARITQPLLFVGSQSGDAVVDLGSRNHLLIDDALFPIHQGIVFAPTPPGEPRLVLPLEGTYRKHATVVDDGAGQVRLYLPAGREDRLAVFTSRDGVHFEAPHLTDIDPQHPNILMAEQAGTPTVFRDPLAPSAERWKLVSGDGGSGIFVFTSPDGLKWKRLPVAALAARSGSQSNMFYDDQRGAYVGYHRTDSGRNVFGKTERRFVTTLLDSLQPPWPFTRLTQADYDRMAETVRLHPLRPWYLDNGPLTPGGVGPEFPLAFRPTDGFDPPATDIYVPKAVKYEWAPDTYLAFPCVYYHYEATRPAARSELGEDSRHRGSGPIETQLMTSRDGLHWNRYPRPAWLGVGLTDGWDVHQTYMAQGMVRRGDEIWMYVYNNEEYHSPVDKTSARRGIFRTVQRADRFVAAMARYEQAGTLCSRPFSFAGKRLVLNVDTGASGDLQVGLLNGDGTPIAGYGLDDCVYVNGNELRYEVEWLHNGADLSKFAGRPVRLVIRMRGTSLYALQFVQK